MGDLILRFVDESGRDCVTWDTCSSSQDTISHPSHSAIYITSQHTQTITQTKRFIEQTNQTIDNSSIRLCWLFVLRCNDMFKLTLKLSTACYVPSSDKYSMSPCLYLSKMSDHYPLPPTLHYGDHNERHNACKHKLLVRNVINTLHQRQVIWCLLSRNA